jgi:hypothetical protein
LLSSPQKYHSPLPFPPTGPTDNPKTGQERLHRYGNKLRRAANEDELARSRPGTELNVAAANRFISQAIPDLTPEQRRRLREQNAAGRGDGEAAAGAGRGGGRGGRGGSKRARGEEAAAAAGVGGTGMGSDLEEILAAAVDGGT